MVALGFLAGTWLAMRRAERTGLSPRAINDVALLCLGFGIAGAHLVSVIGENPSVLWKNPVRLLHFWSGLSSYGGFLGAGTAVALYFRRKGLPFLPHADTLIFGLFPGWTLGRIGCFLAHDHPGRLTDFFLAVRFPDGPRHDLGLYEAMVALGISVAVYFLGRKRRPDGFFFALALTAYPMARFLLDFLRASDLPGSNPRYVGLTLPQYGSIALFLWGALLWRKLRSAREDA
jgi:phosphatidylglycerol:prolipoprotein diacylglycerol transferase